MTPHSISFVLPMYNEKGAIGNTVETLTRLVGEIAGEYEIIIADDASSDGSGPAADKLAKKDPRVKVVHLEKNTKFGGALTAGIKRARKDIIIYIDSDLPVDPEDVKKALSLIGRADIVTAYSTVKKGETAGRIIMSKVYNFLIQFLFRTNIKDINSGFKIYKKKVFDNMELFSKSPFVDVEIFVKAARKNFIIKQYPIIFQNAEKGESYISRPAVVLRTMFDMLRFKFSAK